MPRQPRIHITKRTTPERLLKEVRSRVGEPYTIVGKGEHARKLLDQLAQVVPDLQVHRFGGPAEEIPPGEEDWAPYMPVAEAVPYEYMAQVGENPPAVIIPG
jgi:hypothetical protein